MSLGFQSAGWDLVLAIDNWDAAIQCYGRNIKGHTVLRQDLSEVPKVLEILKKQEFDILIGGPPCQDFSTAGKKVEGKRAKLTTSFAAIVAGARPKFFVMENVESAQKSKAFAAARQKFKSAGYGVTEVVLDASYCGVPQRRKRLFCIGILEGADGVILPLLQSRQSDLPSTPRNYLRHKLKYYYAHPRTYRRRAVFSIDEPAPTIRSGSNRPVPPDYRCHQSDPIDPLAARLRSLTMEERAALQMFPKDFKWGDSRIDNELLISNAVPVGLAKFVGQALLDYAMNPEILPNPCFLNWLGEAKNFSDTTAKRILARYRRAGRLVGKPFQSDKKLCRDLSRNETFKALSEKVRANLMSACSLHMEFEMQKRNQNGAQA